MSLAAFLTPDQVACCRAWTVEPALLRRRYATRTRRTLPALKAGLKIYQRYAVEGSED